MTAAEYESDNAPADFRFCADQADCSEVYSVISRLLSTSNDRRFFSGPGDFSRNGPLTPELLITLLVYMVADGNRRGYRHLLDGFWGRGTQLRVGVANRRADIGGFILYGATYKITPELLRNMLHDIASTSFQTTFESQRWCGRRVFALDGTKINLQRGDDLEGAFGVPEGGYCPQVLVSVLLDVCAKAPVDAEVSPFASSEREHLLNMLSSLERSDVLVLDRGYPSHEVLQALVQEGIDFLVRVPSTQTRFEAIEELRESDGDDFLYYVDPPKGAPPEWTRLTLRTVRLRNADGEESFCPHDPAAEALQPCATSVSCTTCAGRPRSSTSSSRDPTSVRGNSDPNRLRASNRRSAR